MPIKVIITSGTTADCKKAVDLMEDFDAETILADKAYDTDKIVETFAQRYIVV